MDTLRVGFEVLLEVGIDPSTGNVVDVTVYTEEANGVVPIHVYHDHDGDITKDDPRYEWAAKIASGVSIGMSNDGERNNVPWKGAA